MRSPAASSSVEMSPIGRRRPSRMTAIATATTANQRNNDESAMLLEKAAAAATFNNNSIIASHQAAKTKVWKTRQSA